MWNQVYDPFQSQVLSTIAAALPVVTLLVLIASNKVKAHIAAVIALVVANLVAIYLFTMPAGMSLRATVLGVATGFFPIGWIVLNVIFLYRLTVEKGVFQTLQTTIGGVTTDRRCQRGNAAAVLDVSECPGAHFTNTCVRVMSQRLAQCIDCLARLEITEGPGCDPSHRG